MCLYDDGKNNGSNLFGGGGNLVQQAFGWQMIFISVAGLTYHRFFGSDRLWPVVDMQILPDKETLTYGSLFRIKSAQKLCWTFCLCFMAVRVTSNEWHSRWWRLPMTLTRKCWKILIVCTRRNAWTLSDEINDASPPFSEHVFDSGKIGRGEKRSKRTNFSCFIIIFIMYSTL